MRRLYEIDEDILSCVDTETGEIIDTEKLDALTMEREAKIEAVILWRKDIKAEREAVKAEYQNLKKRADSLAKTEDSLTEYIRYALEGEKFKTARCSVSYRATKKIVIDDVNAVDPCFWGSPKEEWISKEHIKEVIESGGTVKGAHQETAQSIIIR